MSCQAVHTDAQRTNRSGNSLANGGSRLSGMPQASTRLGLACWFVVEPPAGIEPATPSLPSMRRRFTPPRGTSRDHTTVQVRAAAKGWIVERREVARSAVSGKSLARALRGSSVTRTPTPASRAVLDDKRLHLQCTAVLGRLRVECRANGEASSVIADGAGSWQSGESGCGLSSRRVPLLCLARDSGTSLGVIVLRRPASS
jgi:hypothetical protein